MWNVIVVVKNVLKLGSVVLVLWANISILVVICALKTAFLSANNALLELIAKNVI